MHRFIKYFLIFIIPLIITAVILEYSVRQIPNTYWCKYEWMEQHAEDVEVLLMGSSHILYGVKPSLFPCKTFNLGNVSQEIEQDLWLLKHWESRYRHLKTVVLTMSTCFWFNKGLDKSVEDFRCTNYKIYMHCDLFSDFSEYNLEIANWPVAKEKLKDAFKQVVGKGEFNLKTLNPGCDSLGWGNIYSLKNKDMEVWHKGTDGIAAARRHTVDNWDYVSKNYRLMQELATFCRHHHIQLVLITTPTYHDYYDNVNSRQLAKMLQLTQEFQQEYHIPYFNYLKDSRFQEDDFFDSNHLSDVGADKFTKILISDIASLCNR